MMVVLHKHYAFIIDPISSPFRAPSELPSLSTYQEEVLYVLRSRCTLTRLVKQQVIRL